MCNYEPIFTHNGHLDFNQSMRNVHVTIFNQGITQIHAYNVFIRTININYVYYKELRWFYCN